MNQSIQDEWMDIVRFNAIDVIGLQVFEEESEDLKEMQDRQGEQPSGEQIFGRIFDIFRVLSKIRTHKVYTQTEISIIFNLIKDTVFMINDIFIKLNLTQLPSLVYEIIYNITEELILLLEDNELYEGCENLLNLRDYWFSLMNVKINKPLDVK